MARTTKDEIRSGLNGLSQEAVQPEHLAGMMEQVRQAGDRSHGGRRVLIGTAGGLLAVSVLFFALLLIPVSYNQQVGCLVSVTGSAAWLEGNDWSSLGSGLPDLLNLSMSTNPEDFVINLAFREIDTPAALELVRSTMADQDLDTAGLQLTGEDVFAIVGGNALAAITNGTINVNSAGLTDAEIAQAIINALAAQGITGGSAVVTTTQEGDAQTRTIEITIPEEHEGTHTIQVGP